MIVFTWVKDALLCLLICATLANIKKNKKAALISLSIVIVLFLMGFDM